MHPDKRLKGKFFIIGFLIGAVISASLVLAVRGTSVENVIWAIIGIVISFVTTLITPWIENLRSYFNPKEESSVEPKEVSKDLYTHTMTIKDTAEGHVVSAKTSITIPKKELTTEDFNKLSQSMLPQIGAQQNPQQPEV